MGQGINDEATWIYMNLRQISSTGDGRRGGGQQQSGATWAEDRRRRRPPHHLIHGPIGGGVGDEAEESDDFDNKGLVGRGEVGDRCLGDHPCPRGCHQCH